jgi:hypothetical protein
MPNIARPRNIGNVGAVLAGLNGAPRLLGTIVATNTVAKDNLNTAGPSGPFLTGSGGLSGLTLMVQPNQDCYWSYIASGSAAVHSGSGVYLEMNERDYFIADERTTISAIGATATVYLKVFDVTVDPFQP